MSVFQSLRVSSLRAGLAAASLLAFSAPAPAALYQCTSATGEVLLTDAGCPPGYATDLVVPEPATPEVARAVSSPPPAAAPLQPDTAAGGAAQIELERENARLRAQLQEERLRAIDEKLDTLLEAQSGYGGVAVVPFGAVPKPFPACRGKPGQTPWVNCHPGRGDPKRKAVRSGQPACGIAGCTPGIFR